MTLRLHDYDASGNCYKVRLLLAQLGREYERVPVDIFGGDTLTDEFGRLNPVRETPVLEKTAQTRSPSRTRSWFTLPRGPCCFPSTRPSARRCCAGSSGSSRR